MAFIVSPNMSFGEREVCEVLCGAKACGFDCGYQCAPNY